MGIQRVDLGPSLAAPVPPSAYQAPRMGQIIPLPEARVHRVTEPELGGVLDWLVPRLKEKHPRLAEEGLVSQLRGALTDRNAIFACAGDVVGYFSVQRTLLDTEHPIVVERFVRQRQPATEDAILLYQYVRDVAYGLKALELRFNVDSDAPMVQHVNPALHDPKRNIRTRKESLYIASLLTQNRE